MSKDSFEMEEELGNTASQIDKVDMMNVLAWELRNTDKERSFELSKEACRLSQEAGYKTGTANGLLGIGIHHTFKSEYIEAFSCLHAALAYFEELEEYEGQIKVHNNLGNTYEMIGKCNDAANHYLQGIKIAKETNNEGLMMSLLNNISVLYDEMGRIEESLQYLFEALAYDVGKDDFSVGVILNNIGQRHLKNGNTDMALDYCKRSLLKAKENNAPRLRAIAYRLMGKIHSQLDRPKEACEYYQKALDDFDAEGDKYEYCSTLYEFCLVYSSTGEDDKALARLSEAASAAEEISANLLLDRMYYLMAEIYERKGQLEKAIAYYKKHMTMNKSIATTELEQKLTNLTIDTKMEQTKKDAEIYRLKNVELKQKSVEVEQKAQELEESYRNITVISEIGQRITASLDIETVLNTIYENVNALMDATVFGIGLYDEENGIIEYKMFIEGGKRLPLYQISIDEKESFAAECIRKREPIIINDLSNLVWQAIPDSIEKEDQIPLSLIYYPLIIESKSIGMFSIQSYKKNAYTSHHVDTIRALASYITIALNNSKKSETLKHTATELGKALQHLKQAQMQLIQTEKMAVVGQMVAGVAHEINTPLASIKSNVDMEKMMLGMLFEVKDETVAAYLESAVSMCDVNTMALDRIIEIVKSLKNFARLDEAAFKMVNIHEGLDSTVVLIKNQLGKRIVVEKEYGVLPLVPCYPQQLNQVFLNILVNAIHAIEDKGKISILTRCDSDKVYISITDTGTGIPKENLTKIFDPGFTTKGVGVGTGLGLSISYNIIEKHNGAISVESALGAGTTFTIELPLRHVKG